MRKGLAAFIFIFSSFFFSIAHASNFPEEFNGSAFGSTLPSWFKLEQEMPMGFGEHIPNQFYTNPKQDEKDFYGYKTSKVEYEFEDKKFIAATFQISANDLAKVEKDFTAIFKTKSKKAQRPPGNTEDTYIYLSKRSGMHLTQKKDKTITVYLFSRAFGEDNKSQ